MNNVEWTFWSGMKEVKLSEAAALSLGIDPDGIRWDESEGSFGLGREFDKRLRLLQSNASDRKHFPTACTLDLGSAWACGVVLSEAGDYLRLQGYKLPDEFPSARMLGKTAISRTLELPESEPIRFAELAHLMAQAMWPEQGDQDDRMQYGVARMSLDEELKSAVEQGRLVVRDPSTLARQIFTMGAALDRTVLLPLDDLRPYLAKRGGVELRLMPFGSGPTYWTLESAADALATQQLWHQGARDSLLARMSEAARAGLLIIRDPHTLLPVRPTVVRSFYELVCQVDVNAWLQTQGVPYCWNVSAQTRSADVLEETDARDPTSEKVVLQVQPDFGEPQKHKMRNRTDPLSAVIEMAKASAADSRDHLSVWAALVSLSRSPNRPSPIIGYAEAEGVKYEVAEQEEPKFFTKEALRKRMGRSAQGR